MGKETSSVRESFRSEIIFDKLIEPANRCHPFTEFTLDTSEALKALEASDEPIFEIGFDGENETETPDIEWTERSISEASEFYEGLSEELSDIFGEDSIVHLYEVFDLNDSLRLSDRIEDGSKRHRLWLYSDGNPHIVMQGVVPEDEAPELIPVEDSKWEVDHYLSEGRYLTEEEIIRSNVPSGDQIVDIMDREPNERKVEELQDLWNEYNSNKRSKVEKDREYSELFAKVKGIDYSPEDVRELSKRNTTLIESNNRISEERFGLLLSAMMNASDQEAFPLTGYWSTGYRNDGNDIFIEDDAPWLGMDMQEGTISAPYSFNFNEPEDEYEIKDLGYLQIVEARRTGLQG